MEFDKYKPSNYDPNKYSNNYESSYTSQHNKFVVETDHAVQNNEHYVREVRELRTKIELLEDEKSTLIDKIRAYERDNGFANLNTQETIEVYRQEIENLKIQINKLNEMYDQNQASAPEHSYFSEVIQLRQEVTTLNSKVTEYEENLIQAQNHIIRLENERRPSSHTESTSRLEAEVASLRDTIARYTEHIEDLNRDRERLEKSLELRYIEINELTAKNGRLALNIEVMEKTLERSRVSKEVVASGVDYDTYSKIAIEYGRVSLQSVVLLNEIDRLNEKVNELTGHLSVAESEIMRLHEVLESQQSGVAADASYEVQRLREEIELLTNKLAETEQQRSHVEQFGRYAGNGPEVSHEIEVKTREVEELRTELQSLNSKYQEMTQNLEKAEDYIITLQEDIRVSQSGSPGQANVELEKLKQENELLSSQLRSSQQGVSAAPSSEEVFELRTKVARLEAEVREGNEHLIKAEEYILTLQDDFQKQQAGAAPSSGGAVSSSPISGIKGREEVEQLRQQLEESQASLEMAEGYILSLQKEMGGHSTNVYASTHFDNGAEVN